MDEKQFISFEEKNNYRGDVLLKISEDILRDMPIRNDYKYDCIGAYQCLVSRDDTYHNIITKSQFSSN